MDVEIVYFDGCPNWRLAQERVAAALVAAGHGEVAVRLQLVANPEEAADAGMHGSPTILVNGRDPFPNAAESIWSCRLYPGETGYEGAPSVSALVEVLR